MMHNIKNMSNLILIRGYPASGKSTQGKLLQQEGKGTFIDHNDILNFISSYTKNDDGIYEDINNLELAMTNKLLEENNDVIVARGFSSLDSIQKYINVGTKNNSKIYIFRIDADISNLENRVLDPNRKSGFNPVNEKESLSKYIKDSPMQNLDNEIIINSNLDKNEVLKKILENIR